MAHDLNILTIADGQADGQWQTSNDADAAIANALADLLSVDFSGGDVTLTATEFRSAMMFFPSGLAANQALTIPAVKRGLFLVHNSDATWSITVTKGSSTVEVAPGEIGIFKTDGTTNSLDGAVVEADASGSASVPFRMTIAVGDETTDITTGTAKVTFRMSDAVTLSEVRASLTTASSSGAVTVDINEAGSTILSTKLTIDQSEKTSTTAATAAVISDTSLADDAEITIDIDGAGTGAKGLKVTLIGVYA